MAKLKGNVLRLLGLYFLARIVVAQAIDCKATLNANRTATYLISRPGQPECSFYWEDENKTVLANEKEYDPKRVVSQNQTSLTTKDCHKHLHYITTCKAEAGGTQEAQCNATCVSQELEQAPCDRITCYWKEILITGCIFTIALLVSLMFLGYRYREKLRGVCCSIKQKGCACCCPGDLWGVRVESPPSCIYTQVKKQETSQ